MSAAKTCLAGVLLTLCSDAMARVADMTIAVADDLRTLDARVCFDAAPEALLSGDAAARHYLVSARWNEQPISVRDSRLPMPPEAPPGCATYRVDIGAAADRRALRRSRWQGRSIIVSPEIWLWHPPGDFRLDFELPDGVSVSAPWPRLEDGRYAAGSTPTRWASLVAFGPFATATLGTSGGELEVAVVDDRATLATNGYGEWLRGAADAVAGIHGQFPRRRVQILIVPGRPGGSDPVPWAQVLRGGAPAAHFFVNPAASPEQLQSNWTATHELSHLLLPFVTRRDAWLSEGLASYYQNIARGRSGALTEEAMWRKLLQGFERGRRGARGAALKAASASMNRDGNFMQVYWSGAAILLIADITLREATGNTQSLDSALAGLARCCLDDTPARVWTARELLARLDAITGGTVFTETAARFIGSDRFPAVEPVLDRLGVENDGGRVRLRDDAELAALRRALIAPVAER